MRSLARILLLIFVFAIPWEYSLDFGEPIGNIARIAGLAVALIALLAVAEDGYFRKITPQHWAILGFFLWTCLTAAWSLEPLTTLKKLPGFVQEILVFWLLWELTETTRHYVAVLRCWLAGAWLLSLLTLGTLFTLRNDLRAQARFYASGQDPNDVARFLCLCLPVAALVYTLERSRAGKLLASGYLFLSLAEIVATASRGGILAALAGLIGSVMLLRRRVQIRAWAVVSAGMTLGFFFGLIPPETYLRIFTIADQLGGSDLNQRTVIWSWGWSAFQRAPFFGHGAGTFVSAAGLAPFDTAHNTFLSILVEYGTVGLALFTAVGLLALRSCFKLKDPLRTGLLTILSVWLISALVGTAAESRSTWLMFGVIAVAERMQGIERYPASKSCLGPQFSGKLALPEAK